LTILEFIKLLDITARNEKPMNDLYEVYANLIPSHIPKLSMSQLVYVFNIMTKRGYGSLLNLP
jgi:hypothetical protein